MAQACNVAPSSAARLAAWVEQNRLGLRARPRAVSDLPASALAPRHYRPSAPSSAARWDGLEALELQDNEAPEVVATLHADLTATVAFHRAVAPRSTRAAGQLADVVYAPQLLVGSILATGPP
jgi:hypothetical protein